MEGSDWVALVAVIVTGVSIYFNYRGAEKRQSRRLAHERRQASRADAAKAHMLAANARRKMNWFDIERRGLTGEETLSPGMTQAAAEATDAMELARAYSWNDEVLDAAGEVLENLDALRDSTLLVLSLVISDQVSHSDRERFNSHRRSYTKAIEDFRKEIAK